MEHIILLFFSFFTEAVILWQYASSLFTSSYSNKIKLALLSAFYAILFLISLLGQTGLNAISFFVINTIFLYMLFKLKLLLALFHSAILTAIMGLSELAVFGIISRFFPHFVLETDAGIIFYTVFSKILFFAVIYLLIHLLKGKNINQEQYDRSGLLLMLIPVSSVFIMFTFLAIGETSAFAQPVDFMVTICAVFLLMVNLLVFGINQYNQKKSQEYTDMQLLLQKESDFAQYYEMILSQSENQSILIHDIKKHLQSIKLLNEKNDSDKINAYIQQLLESSDLKETSKICDNEMLNAILCRYQRQCNEKHIVFHTDIRSDTVQNIYQHDLTCPGDFYKNVPLRFPAHQTWESSDGVQAQTDHPPHFYNPYEQSLLFFYFPVLDMHTTTYSSPPYLFRFQNRFSILYSAVCSASFFLRSFNSRSIWSYCLSRS